MQKNNTNKLYYKMLGFSVCGAAKTKPLHGLVLCGFLHGIVVRILCRVFLHDFSPIFERMFCTDLLDGLFARIFARICCAQIFARILFTDFWGVPNRLLRSATISPRKSTRKFSMLWGPYGRGLGGKRVRWRHWPT